MRKFSHAWISSSQPGKQRKYRHNAPLNIRHKMIAAHLSKELRKKYKIRSAPLRKGDSVKIVRGQYKKKTGKVERVLLKKYKLFVSGIERVKRDGSKSSYPLDPSNVIITELNMEDKKRNEQIRRKNVTTPVKV